MQGLNNMVVHPRVIYDNMKTKPYSTSGYRNSGSAFGWSTMSEAYLCSKGKSYARTGYRSYSKSISRYGIYERASW